MPAELDDVDPPESMILGPEPDRATADRRAVEKWDRTKRSLETLDAVMAARAPYLLQRIARDRFGKERFRCPVFNNQCVCPLREWSYKMPNASELPEVTPPPAQLLVEDGVCFQETVTFPPSVAAKTRQRFQWLCRPWRRMYAPRTTVERSFAGMKGSATERVERGWIHLHGRVKTSFMLAVAVMSQNLRLSIKYLKENPDALDPTDPVLRGPAESYGHEALNALGEIERWEHLLNPDQDRNQNPDLHPGD